MVQRPRKKSRRPFAVHFFIAIFSALIVVFLLLLFGLQYWMTARVPLPEISRLVHPQSSAYLMIRSDRSKLKRSPQLQTLKSFLSTDAPKQVARLIEKGLNDPNCSVLVVACLVPAVGEGQMSMTVSLGAYPGVFRLVRRELERGVNKGSFPGTLRYYKNSLVFQQTKDDGKLHRLSLVECTIIRSSSDTVMDALLDRFHGRGEFLISLPYPHTLSSEAHQPLDFWGWANSWEDVRFRPLLRNEKGAALDEFKKSLAQSVPNVKTIRDIHFWGKLQGPEMKFTFRCKNETDAASLASALSEWLPGNGAALIEASGARATQDRVAVSLKLRPTEE